PAPAQTGARVAHKIWYGFYPNGREVVLALEDVKGRDLDAVYAIGPGIDENEPAEWHRRKGHLVDDEFVFDEKGKSTLRFHPRADHGLSVTWTSPDGKIMMEGALRRLDLQSLTHDAEASTPPSPARGGG
ncbi:MAG TPA: hypothetical protein VE687_00660, partial [Stellaceae bacterium]|nr:hypothetical protein [Stellaceae bacterium]